jgi:hypothetical protein
MLSAERLNQRAPREGQHGPPLLARLSQLTQE